MDVGTENMKPHGLKAPMWLIPARAMRAIAAGFKAGNDKGYVPFNWTTQPRDKWREVYGSAAKRHLDMAVDPMESDVDEETGVHHIVLAATNCIIVIWLLAIDYRKGGGTTDGR
jgi:hypothetical protein